LNRKSIRFTYTILLSEIISSQKAFFNKIFLKMILRILGTYHFLIGLITLIIQLSYLLHHYMEIDFWMISLSFVFLYAGLKTFRKKRIGVILLVGLNLFQLINFTSGNVRYNFNFGVAYFYDLPNNSFSSSFNLEVENLPKIEEYSRCVIFVRGYDPIKFNLIGLFIILFLLFSYSKIALKDYQSWEINFQK